ncbi:NYN domain-containing protein [Verminephrobacter aporrectodeae subsp. tuberculatae]|nr:NYN domain-containing protein [Verminephrobacter aporrectodeae subsp. tuberculatae]MCW8167586.1 NYN domain-containing protein [Verminephrobacter aporrectodeae subsp. tuberculatae]
MRARAGAQGQGEPGSGKNILTHPPWCVTVRAYLPACFRYAGAKPPQRGLLHFLVPKVVRHNPGTNVYIDGFNLYFGALRKTPYKWLDLEALCRAYLPKNDITAIKYFTAKVSSRPNDPQQPVRQETYLRAISTLPIVSIIYGHYLSHTVSARLANPPAGGSLYVDIIKTEEKGSDVNLAAHLLHEAHLNKFDIAVVISNDSDLLEPIKLVRTELRKIVGVLNPHKKASCAILPHIDFIKKIRAGVLAECQFPDVLHDAQGVINKPAGW